MKLSIVGVTVDHIWCTFDLVELKVILGTFSALWGHS